MVENRYERRYVLFSMHTPNGWMLGWKTRWQVSEERFPLPKTCIFCTCISMRGWEGIWEASKNSKKQQDQTQFLYQTYSTSIQNKAPQHQPCFITNPLSSSFSALFAFTCMCSCVSYVLLHCNMDTHVSM